MSFTRTHTVTAEEKFILNCFEEATKDEIPARAIVNRAREAEQLEEFTLRLPEELILTVLGQLIQRGMIFRIEPTPGEYCYRRG